MVRRRRGSGASYVNDESVDLAYRIEASLLPVQHAGALRDAVDGHLGEPRSGLTDEEWGSAVSPELPADRADGVRDLLGRAEAVKYGQGAPTRFAVDEALADARRLADALEKREEAKS